MEISYRREMKRNYLVVEPENKEEAGYEARMLEENHIQGLLKMRIKYQEGQPLYYYDITSRQPLSRLLEKRFITKNEIWTILMQLHSTLTRMEAFLLRGRNPSGAGLYLYGARAFPAGSMPGARE